MRKRWSHRIPGSEITHQHFRRTLASRLSIYLRNEELGQLSTLSWGQKLLPHYYYNDPSVMHKWIGDQIDEQFDQRGARIAVVGPRGGAKSTTGNLTPVLRRCVEGKESFVIICSDTATQGIEHLSAIKEELESNEFLQAEYPEAFGIGPVWKKNEIRLRNGVYIRAAGTLSRIRGFRKKAARPSLIVVDDPENDEHISSQNMRTRTETWFNQTLMNMGDSNTNVLALGTALHRECLILKLLKKGGWTVFREGHDGQGRPSPFKAILHWPSRMDLWQEWENIYLDIDNFSCTEDAWAFYRKNRKEMNKDVELLWPDREPLYDLMVLRAMIGHQAFESEKQGNPINPETCEWPEEYFTHDKFWFDKFPDKWSTQFKAIAVDPSKGRHSSHGDYSAIVMVALGADGVYYVDVDMARRPTDEIILDTLKATKKFQCPHVGFESNVFQELLADDFAQECEELDLPCEVIKIENRVKKHVRIRRLTPVLSRRRIRFRRNSKGAALCVQQLRDFPNADHDDGPDGLEMAIRMIAGKLDEVEHSEPETVEITYAS